MVPASTEKAKVKTEAQHGVARYARKLAILNANVGREMMRTSTAILAGLLIVVLVLSASLFLVANRPPAEQPRSAQEVGMTGWPIQKLFTEEERVNQRCALQVLREAIVQQDAKARALQETNTNSSPTEVEELEKQESILATMRRIEHESANKASEAIGASAPQPQR